MRECELLLALYQELRILLTLDYMLKTIFKEDMYPLKYFTLNFIINKKLLLNNFQSTVTVQFTVTYTVQFCK